MQRYDTWVDMLHEKHECFDYEPVETAFDLAGRRVIVEVPRWLPGGDLVHWAERDGLLFLILRTEQEWGDERLGAVLIARQEDDDRYQVVLWHETYPYLFKYLGKEIEG